MTTFNWKVVTIAAYPQVEDQANVVSTVLWRCEATRTVNGVQHSAFIEKGSVLKPYKAPIAADPKLKRPAVTPPPFIPYSELTEAQILNWVWNIKPRFPDSEETVKQIIEAELESTLDRELTPAVVATTLPWG